MRGVPFEVARLRASASVSVSSAGDACLGMKAVDACLRTYVALQQLVLCPSFADPLGRMTGRAASALAEGSSLAGAKRSAGRSRGHSMARSEG